jgi:hypothetical protein
MQISRSLFASIDERLAIGCVINRVPSAAAERESAAGSLWQPWGMFERSPPHGGHRTRVSVGASREASERKGLRRDRSRHCDRPSDATGGFAFLASGIEVRPREVSLFCSRNGRSRGKGADEVPSEYMIVGTPIPRWRAGIGACLGGAMKLRGHHSDGDNCSSDAWR